MEIAVSVDKINKTSQNRKNDLGCTVIDADEKTAARILTACRHFSFRELEDLSCFYLGIEKEPTIEILAQNFNRMHALDPGNLDYIADPSSGYSDRINYVGCENGFPGVADHSVDVVICDRFYDKVDNPEELMFEIYRVLKYDGFCYFSAYNRLSVVEQNYRIPFLSWLPRRVAGCLLKWTGRDEQYCNRLLSLSNLKRLTDNFWRHDYGGLIRRNPQTFGAEGVVVPGYRTKKHFGWWLKFQYPFMPLWTWVLTKKK